MKKLLRHAAEFAGYRLGLSHIPFLLHRLFRRRPILIVMAYHRIVDSRSTATFYTDYDRGLDAEIFRIHLDILQRHFRLIDLDEFIEIITGRLRPKGHSLLLTFDDADSEFVQYALPLLSSRHIPAVMMAPTGLIGSTDQLWHVRISNVIRHATEKQWAELRRRSDEWPCPVAEIIRRTDHPGPIADRRPLARAINAALDLVDHEQVDRLVEAWERVAIPETSLPIRCMNWDQLQMLEAGGVAIESHTASHRKLPTLSDSELENELLESRGILEAKLGKRIRAIAYPQGRLDQRVPGTARKAGYEVGFTTVRTPSNYPLAGDDLFTIPRLDMQGQTPEQTDLYLARVACQCFIRTKPW